MEAWCEPFSAWPAPAHPIAFLSSRCFTAIKRQGRYRRDRGDETLLATRAFKEDGMGH
jgi:hypothetical protein